MERYKCSICHFALFNPVASLRVSSLGLYDDNRFPGRCILALNTHEEHVEDMDPEVLAIYAQDIQKSVIAIKKATGAERVNVSFLGNTIPHIHAHLVPRYPEHEQFPGKSPWDDPRENEGMDIDRIHMLTKLIQVELSQ